MKKSKRLLLTAAAVTAIFTLSGCDPNEVRGVYGPPPDYSGNDNFDPADNQNVNVYGPPPVTENTEV